MEHGCFINYLPPDTDVSGMTRALLFLTPQFSLSSGGSPSLSPFSESSWEGSVSAHLQLVLGSGASYSGEVGRACLRPSVTLWAVVCALCSGGAGGGGAGAAAQGYLRARKSQVLHDTLYLSIVRDPVGQELLSSSTREVNVTLLEGRSGASELAGRLWQCMGVLAQSSSCRSLLLELKSRAEAAEAALARAEEGRVGREEEVLRACAAILSSKRAAVALLQRDLEAAQGRGRSLQLQLDSKEAEVHQLTGKIIRMQQEGAAAAAGRGAAGRREAPAAAAAGASLPAAEASPFSTAIPQSWGAAAAAAGAGAAASAPALEHSEEDMDDGEVVLGSTYYGHEEEEEEEEEEGEEEGRGDMGEGGKEAADSTEEDTDEEEVGGGAGLGGQAVIDDSEQHLTGVSREAAAGAAAAAAGEDIEESCW